MICGLEMQGRSPQRGLPPNGQGSKEAADELLTRREDSMRSPDALEEARNFLVTTRSPSQNIAAGCLLSGAHLANDFVAGARCQAHTDPEFRNISE
jgi:hypothetical protein